MPRRKPYILPRLACLSRQVAISSNWRSQKRAKTVEPWPFLLFPSLGACFFFLAKDMQLVILSLNMSFFGVSGSEKFWFRLR